MTQPGHVIYQAQPGYAVAGQVQMQPGVVMAHSGTVMQPGVQVIQPGMQMVQPGMPMQQIAWATVPAPIPGVPHGLEYLHGMDVIQVEQKEEWMEIFTGFETANRYIIRGTHGQYIYFAAENSDFCSRNCLGTRRPFEMGIYDSASRQVMNIHRPYNCDSCLCPCCLQYMEVQAPPNAIIGYVQQKWSLCLPKFYILDAQNEVVLQIEGPCCTWNLCCGNVEFQILSADGTEVVGKIAKRWGGFLKEMYTDADTFGIEFPPKLKVQIKAVLLAACFLIDFMYFEGKSKDGQSGGLMGAHHHQYHHHHH